MLVCYSSAKKKKREKDACTKQRHRVISFHIITVQLSSSYLSVDMLSIQVSLASSVLTCAYVLPVPSLRPNMMMLHSQGKVSTSSRCYAWTSSLPFAARTRGRIITTRTTSFMPVGGRHSSTRLDFWRSNGEEEKKVSQP